MSVRFFISTILFFACLPGSHAQQPGVKDSLLHVLKTAKDGENKVLLLIRIGQEFENSDLEKSKSFYLQARTLGIKINYRLTEVKFISNYTFALNMQGKFDSSLMWNLSGIEAAKKLGDDVQLAKAYFNTGTSYHYLSDYQPAVEMYQKGLVLLEKMDDKVFMAQAKDILQTLYSSMKQYDKAKVYGKSAVAAFRDLNDPKMLAYSLTNLGTVYGSINQKDSARTYFREAAQIASDINDEVLLATVQLNLGDVSLWKKQLAGGKKYYQSALALAIKNKLPETETIALRGISYYYTYMGDYADALQYAEKALTVSQKHQFSKQVLLNLDQLASLAYLSKDVLKAEKYEVHAKELQDTLWNEQLLRNTINTEKKFELDKKNTRLAFQEETIRHKNLMNGLLTGGLIALLLIAALSYRNYRNRKKIQEQRIKELETEKQLLATQSLLKGQEEERSRIAKDLHDGLGGLLSGVKLQLGAMKGNLILTEENGMAFNRVLNNLEASISEMRRVAHNMMPETLLKFGLQQALKDYSNGLSQQQGFTIRCEFRGMERRLDHSIEVVIYRIVQELLNNAVKHSGATAILVQIMRHDEQRLNITVEDNGKGFDPEAVGPHSAGLRNITSRVKYLNGKMDIQSEPGNGTSIYIECEIKPYG
ncbi:tetratricopeptide repeat-containing sensor histidine kinase [Niabella drilacis]|uniref:Tetratricopeptide repeat-containing protein n=1 Tax=Niabella drilacis (strain DSM 25811 / CCM 8410 / CCUG 62505 / LMG 26954 / E90) TaxID=1285928 RepID=A0A1G6MTD3_NIADE|nr:tetratricopeptide repeat protein [Niabella drilacis]SDC58691.1 Tetratricopeptide repeat-containing protein [Niabella drilacis]